MNRFFLEPHLFTSNRVNYPEDIVHQILDVLRLRSGDQVDVLDNRGNCYRVSLECDPKEKTVYGRILTKTRVLTEPLNQITLCFGLSNREKVEWILQKATEVGVSAFCPFVSSRTVVQSTTLTQNKRDRWQRIIREAAEQSRRGLLPKLNFPQTFDACLYSSCRSADLNLIAWEEENPEKNNIKGFLDSFSGHTISLFVGPEGGFSAEEIQAAKSAGCQVVSLGPRILRMETAAIIFPALVLHELDGS